MLDLVHAPLPPLTLLLTPGRQGGPQSSGPGPEKPRRMRASLTPAHCGGLHSKVLALACRTPQPLTLPAHCRPASLHRLMTPYGARCPQNEELAPHVAVSPEDSARRDSYTYTPTEVRAAL